MRDDIHLIVNETSLAVEIKIELLNRFLAKEHELNSILKTDFENEPLLIIESEDDIISEINVQDYIISGLNDEFRNKTGKNLLSSELDQFNDAEGKLANLALLRSKEKIIISEISVLREINNALMHTVKKEILEDAEDLKRMRQIEMIIPKDSRSSF